MRAAPNPPDEAVPRPLEGTDAVAYLPSDERERAAQAILEAHPDAAVASADEAGLFIALADGLAEPGRATLEGRGAIDLIAGGDRVAMLRAWTACQATGSSRAVAELVSGERGTFHFLDLRERFGSHLVILVRSTLLEGRRNPLAMTVGPVAPRYAITLRDDQAAFLSIDEAVTGMLGWTLEDLQGVLGLDLIHPDDQDRALANWIEMLTEPEVPHRWRGRHQHRDGSWQWVEFTTHNEIATCGHVRSELYDISGEMAAVDALQDRERLLREIAEALPVGVVRLELDGSVVYANQRALDDLGVVVIDGVSDVLDAIASVDRGELQKAIDGASTNLVETYVQVNVTPAAGGPIRHLDCRVRRLGGRVEDTPDVVLSIVDVTEAVHLRQELQRRADTDSLTGALSRSAALRRISSISSGTAIVYLDLNKFKEINDRHGHAAGDAVLCSVVDRLVTTVGDRGSVARFGGDEFVVIAARPDVASATALGEEIARAVDHELRFGDTILHVHASVGVTWTDDEAGGDADHLIARADHAMYRSKHELR